MDYNTLISTWGEYWGKLAFLAFMLVSDLDLSIAASFLDGEQGEHTRTAAIVLCDILHLTTRQNGNYL